MIQLLSNIMLYIYSCVSQQKSLEKKRQKGKQEIVTLSKNYFKNKIPSDNKHKYIHCHTDIHLKTVACHSLGALKREDL